METAGIFIPKKKRKEKKNTVTFYGNQGLSDRIILFGIDGDNAVSIICFPFLAKFHIYR